MSTIPLWKAAGYREQDLPMLEYGARGCDALMRGAVGDNMLDFILEQGNHMGFSGWWKLRYIRGPFLGQQRLASVEEVAAWKLLTMYVSRSKWPEMVQKAEAEFLANTGTPMEMVVGPQVYEAICGMNPLADGAGSEGIPFRQPSESEVLVS